MAQVVNVSGTIVSNDDAQVYEWLEMDYTAPSTFDEAIASGEDLIVNINSVGGDTFAGEEIYTRLMMYSGNVTVNVLGLAASAASVIAMGGDKVNISPAGQIMIHNVSVAQFGDYRDMDKASEILKKTNNSLANAYVRKTGKSMDEILSMMDDETWLTADEAVENGFADAIIGEQSENDIQLVASSADVLPKKVINKISKLKAENERLKADVSTGKQVVTVDIRGMKEFKDEINKFKAEVEEALNNDESPEKNNSLGFSNFIY